VFGYIRPEQSYLNVIIQDLIDALVKKPKSQEIAKTLKMVSNNDKSYDLVIRKANLTLKDAKKIANVINKVSQNNGPKLHTISMSLNQALKDDGVITILNQITKTTSVIAFVECGITDKAGQSIIDWAANANYLNRIYVEGNTFFKRDGSKI
jgi:hypothetical protein